MSTAAELFRDHYRVEAEKHASPTIGACRCFDCCLRCGVEPSEDVRAQYARQVERVRWAPFARSFADSLIVGPR